MNLNWQKTDSQIIERIELATKKLQNEVESSMYVVWSDCGKMNLERAK